MLTLHETDYSNGFTRMYGDMDGGNGWDTASGSPSVWSANNEVRWIS